MINIFSKSEIRKAKVEDIQQLKEIWQLCFKDTTEYIDYYFANQFKEDQTRVLVLDDGNIGAMLSLKPANIITFEELIISSMMLYAIATHPKYQNQGLASQLIESTNQELAKEGINNTVLVPAEPSLFDFYKKQGYQEAFYTRESMLTPDQIIQSHPGISFSCFLVPADIKDYNLRRNKLLNGSYFVAYDDHEIKYQKEIAQQSGGDIFSVVLPDLQGCAIIERVSQQRVIIKELLVYKAYFPKVLRHIAEEFPADEYILRTSSYLDHKLAGQIRPFGMIKSSSHENLSIPPNEKAYLGLAFD